jgi:hypothetical protein
MASTNIWDYSTTAASNTSVEGTSINTGMSPANVDNALRDVIAMLANSFATALEGFLTGASALPVANGGTGATSAAAALTALGGLEDDYRDLPIISKGSAFTFANSERSNGINYTGAAAAATIDPNATTAINTGAVYVIRNNGSGALTITRGAGVSLKQNGSTTSANATLAVGGICSLTKWGTDDWTVSGSGLS